jgi:hypothetical protein
MSTTEWQDAIEVVTPHVVKISTPEGSGTGFLVSYASQRSLCVIATAAHVVQHAHTWELPIRIKHFSSGESIMLHAAQRAIFLDEQIDTAAILFSPQEMKFPEEPLTLIPEKHSLKIGNEVGWLGFPAISPNDLCFFTGIASCFLQKDAAYLVDGVAINGVSGGPTFHVATDGKTLRIIGVVSAYIPNTATGQTLPGMCVVRDVLQFQELSRKFTSVDEAKDEETETTPTPTTEPTPPTPPEPETVL